MTVTKLVFTVFILPSWASWEADHGNSFLVITQEKEREEEQEKEETRGRGGRRRKKKRRGRRRRREAAYIRRNQIPSPLKHFFGVVPISAHTPVRGFFVF